MNKMRFLLLLCLSCLLMVPAAQAQKKIAFFWQKNDLYDENTRYHVGITFPQISFSHYFLEKSSDWNALTVPHMNGQFTEIKAPNGISAGLGIPVDIRLYKNLHLATGATFMVYNGDYTLINMTGRGLEYYIENDPAPINRMESHGTDGGSNFPSYEIPLHLKLRSEHKRIKVGDDWLVTRAYLIGGGKYTGLLGAKRYYEGGSWGALDPPLIITPHQFSWEVGFGMDFLFTYFKVSPEIRFSQSIGNLLDKRHSSNVLHGTPNPFTHAIDRLGIRGVQFTLIIE